jgi:hypothetical protein
MHDIILLITGAILGALLGGIVTVVLSRPKVALSISAPHRYEGRLGIGRSLHELQHAPALAFCLFGGSVAGRVRRGGPSTEPATARDRGTAAGGEAASGRIPPVTAQFRSVSNLPGFATTSHCFSRKS